MSRKELKRVNIPESTKIRFIDKRTTVTLEDVEGIRYYDLEASLTCSGYFTKTIRGEIAYQPKGDYITFTFHSTDEVHYRNFYTRRTV